MCFRIFHLFTWLLVSQFCSCPFRRTPTSYTDGCIGGAAVLTWEYDTTSLDKVVWRKDGHLSLIVDKTGNVLFTKNEIEYVSYGTVKINTSAFLESINWCSICVKYTLESRKRTIRDTVYVTISESLQENNNSPEDKEKCSCKLTENPNVKQQDVNSKSRNKTAYQNHTMKRCNIGRAIMCITESYTPGTNTSCEREHEVTTSTHVELYTTILPVTFMVMVVLLLYVVISLVKRKRGAKKKCCEADCVCRFKFLLPVQDVCSGGPQDNNQFSTNSMKEDKPVLNEVNIRAATPDRLKHLECSEADCSKSSKLPKPALDVCSGGLQDSNQFTTNLMEEVKPVLHGVNIRAATSDRLIHLGVERFDCVRGFKFSMSAQDVCSGGLQDSNQSATNLMEEDKPLLQGVNIRAATPPKKFTTHRNQKKKVLQPTQQHNSIGEA